MYACTVAFGQIPDKVHVSLMTHTVFYLELVIELDCVSRNENVS